MSQLVSEPYEYDMRLTAIFSKTYDEDMVQCLLSTIVVLTGGKLT
jgi:hypothetical protein